MRSKRLDVIKFTKTYLKDLNKEIIILSVCSLLAIPISLVSPKIFQFLIDEVIEKNNSDFFVYVLIGLLLVYVIRFLIDATKLHCSNKFLNSFTYKLRNKILNTYLKMSFKSLSDYDTGNLKMKVYDDVNSLGNFVKEQIIDYFCSVILILILIVLCLSINSIMFLCCVGFIPLLMIVDIVIANGTSKINNEIREVNEEYCSFEYSSIQNWKEIKSQCAEVCAVRQFNQFRNKLAKLGMTFIRYWLYRELYNDFKANYINKVLIYIIGTFFVINNELSVGNLILFGEYFGYLFTECNNFYSKKVSLNANSPFYERIKEALSFSTETGGVKCDTFFPIELRNVSFSYDDKSQVLSNINMTINENDFIQIGGLSGIGKTTLIKLLLGLIEPTSGTILYASIPLNKIDKKFLYEKIGIVMQDDNLFNTSIRENLILHNQNINDVEIMRVCNLTNIGDFIASLPNGLDTVVGENGVKLSGGQRQRLLIARALLKEPELVLLDEAFSSVDGISERIIQDTFENKCRVKAILSISHKFSKINNKYRNIILENCKLEEKDYEKRMSINS